MKERKVRQQNQQEQLDKKTLPSKYVEIGKVQNDDA